MNESIYEASHSTLKECYFTGLSIPDFRIVCVVYKLDRNNVSEALDDKRTTMFDAKSDLKKHVTDLVKKNVHKMGHGEFISRATPIRFIDIETKKTISSKKLTLVPLNTIYHAGSAFSSKALNPTALTKEERDLDWAYFKSHDRPDREGMNSHKAHIYDVWTFPRKKELFKMLMKHCGDIFKKNTHVMEIGKVEQKASPKSTIYPTSAKDAVMNAATSVGSLFRPRRGFLKALFKDKGKSVDEYKQPRQRGVAQRKALDKFKETEKVYETVDCIKALYHQAKHNPSKIDAYREAVEDLMENNPAGYIKSIDVILPSSIGAKTFVEFVSRHGISIASYQQIMECINSCVEKMSSRNGDVSIYEDAIELMHAFKDTYYHNFYMFENFSDELKSNYVEAYYKNFPVLREGKEVNFSKIIERFGESVIPDMIVYADVFGTSDSVLNPFRERYDRLDTITKLWLEECEKDVYIEGVFDKIFSGRKPTNSSTSQAEPTHLRMTPKIFVLNDLKKEHGDFLRKLFKEFYLNIPLVINTDETFNQLRKHIDGISNNINEYLALDMISRFEFEFFGSMTDIGLIDYHMEVNIFDGLDVGTDVPTRFMNMISNKICNELSEKYKTQLKQYGLVIEKPFDDGDDKFALWLKSVDDTLYQGYKENLGMHTERTILSIIDRREKIYQESIILGEEKEVSFTESELESIQDLISFKENLITLVESEEERMQLQREVYDLYEGFFSMQNMVKAAHKAGKAIKKVSDTASKLNDRRKSLKSLIENDFRFQSRIAQVKTLLRATHILKQLSEKDIREILEEFSKKYNCEVIFTTLPVGDGGGAMMVKATDAVLDMYRKNMVFEFINAHFAQNNSPEKMAILFNVDEIYCQYPTKGNLLRTIEHEYGHIATWHLVSEQDLNEYNTRIEFCPYIVRFEEIGRNINVIYWEFKPEKLANQYAKMDMRKLSLDCGCTEYIPSKVPGHKLATVTIPPGYDKTSLRKAMSVLSPKKNKTMSADIRKVLKETRDIFNTILSDKPRKRLIPIMDEVLSIPDGKVIEWKNMNLSVSDRAWLVKTAMTSNLLSESNDFEEDVADSVIPMLPGANQNVGTRSINEDWLNNTHNKKTGSTPDYLKNAHDLSWGEDDAPPKKRPSASNDDKPDDDDDILYDNKKEKDPLDKIEPFDYDANKSDSSDDKKDEVSKSSGHIQNYYYYTYNNSNNTHSTTNTNSYNRNQDDHSRNKRTKSHDYGGLKEEKHVWELDVPTFVEPYEEGFSDVLKKLKTGASRIISKFQIKRTLPSIQNVDIMMRNGTIPKLPLMDEVISKMGGK